MTRMRKDWTSLAFDSWSLGIEASTVIGLRLAKLARMDGEAVAEAHRMVAEKMEAAAELQLRAMTGNLGSDPKRAAHAAVAHYRKAVGRNRRRLGGKGTR